MIDDDIEKLNFRQPDHPLESLEADVWAGVAARVAARRASRMIVSCQMAAMAVALVLVVATGSLVGRSFVNGQPFASDMRLAPSTLLLGSHA